MKEADDLGFSKMPLCREPWESFYILRRGILPCCYGNPIIGAMPYYAEVWNSPDLQDIRRHLGRGELSPYCRESLGCPIVQRVLRKEEEEGAPAARRRPSALRFVNKMFFGIPGKIRRLLRLR